MGVEGGQARDREDRADVDPSGWDAPSLNEPESEATRALWEAALAGSALGARRALALGANPQAVRRMDGTPLMSACRAGGLAAARALLAVSDPNAAHPLGGCALFWAAAAGHAHIVEELLSAGADPRARAKDGRDALMIAAQEGSAHCVEALLKVCDPLLVDRDGRDALMGAAEAAESPRSLALLLPASDPLRKSGAGLTALMMAAESGWEEGARMLWSRSDALAVDRFGRDAMALARLAEGGLGPLGAWMQARAIEAACGSAPPIRSPARI